MKCQFSVFINLPPSFISATSSFSSFLGVGVIEGINVEGGRQSPFLFSPPLSFPFPFPFPFELASLIL